MTREEYLEGVDFIKRNSGTDQEEAERLAYWGMLAEPLVGKKIEYPQGVL